MIKNATQSFVPINEIRNGVLILNDGNMRAILSSSSINLSLLSEDEQAATFSGFQTFLNSLDFQVQIFLQSKKLDIRNYLDLLSQREKEVEEDLLKLQIKEYREFIKKFTEEQNIMSKSFYIVVPYDLAKLGMASQQMAEDDFIKNYNNLMQRVEVVRGTLIALGLKINLIKTEELIELYYKLFNPNELNAPVYLEAE